MQKYFQRKNTEHVWKNSIRVSLNPLEIKRFIIGCVAFQ